jgi:hypothetical protein
MQGEPHEQRPEQSKTDNPRQASVPDQDPEAKLDTLKAQAETAKANVEIKAIAELLAKKHVI